MTPKMLEREWLSRGLKIVDRDHTIEVLNTRVAELEGELDESNRTAEWFRGECGKKTAEILEIKAARTPRPMSEAPKGVVITVIEENQIDDDGVMFPQGPSRWLPYTPPTPADGETGETAPVAPGDDGD